MDEMRTYTGLLLTFCKIIVKAEVGSLFLFRLSEGASFFFADSVDIIELC